MTNFKDFACIRIIRGRQVLIVHDEDSPLGAFIDIIFCVDKSYTKYPHRNRYATKEAAANAFDDFCRGGLDPYLHNLLVYHDSMPRF